MFSKEYEIKYYEQNMKGDLKESTLLNFLQDIATLNAESLGFGPTFVFSNNYAWVVLKYHIELYREIKNFESIIINTEPRGTSKLYAFRDFEILSKNNEILGKVTSTWALIDMNSRRMLPMQKTLDFLMPFEKKENDVKYDDIDVNQHANNCNYIIWALETLPQDFRLKHSPKSIDIKYRKEVGLNGKVLSQAELIQNGNSKQTLHLIKDSESNEELTTVLINWQ